MQVGQLCAARRLRGAEGSLEAAAGARLPPKCSADAEPTLRRELSMFSVATRYHQGAVWALSTVDRRELFDDPSERRKARVRPIRSALCFYPALFTIMLNVRRRLVRRPTWLQFRTEARSVCMGATADAA